MNSLTEDTLFTLLRLALGQSSQSSFSQDISWDEVYRLSVEQQVAAIACDGLQKASRHPDSGLILQGLGKEKYLWSFQKMCVEKTNRKNTQVLFTLSDLFESQGLELFILKGMSFARYYPIPDHRYSADVDFFVRYGNQSLKTHVPAWRRADALVSSNGGSVDSSWAKHSKGCIDGVPIENHRHLIGVKGSRQCKSTDILLKRLLLSSDRLCDHSHPGLSYPSWMFNALFCLYHARHHFLVESGITLRHVCDWAMIRQSADARTSDSLFLTMVDRMGIRRFFEALNGVTDFVMGQKEKMDEKEALMLEDLLAPRFVKKEKSRFMARLDLLRSIWNNAWKFRLYSDRSMPVFWFRYVLGYMFDDD